jgi:transposase-like protein
MLRIVVSDDDREGLELDLDAICRDGARKMLRTALRAEVSEYIESARGEVDEQGHALVVRNGSAKPRAVTTSSGAIAVEAPRVDDRREGERFTSAILPP